MAGEIIMSDHKQGGFTDEELRLLGLSGRMVPGILDTDEKARGLREEFEREVLPVLRSLERASARSHAKAHQYVVG
jgi:hypothetical protein